MKLRVWISVCIAVVAVLGLNSCVPFETSRGVQVDNSKGSVSVFRHRRMMAMMTPEGPFPSVDLWLSLYPTNSISKDQEGDILVPATASVRAGEIQTGVIHLDPKRGKAKVRVVPSDHYYWLKLDGEYPLTFIE